MKIDEVDGTEYWTAESVDDFAGWKILLVTYHKPGVYVVHVGRTVSNPNYIPSFEECKPGKEPVVNTTNEFRLIYASEAIASELSEQRNIQLRD